MPDVVLVLLVYLTNPALRDAFHVLTTDEVCLEDHATCGYLQRDDGSLARCGECEDPTQECSLGMPNPDGSIGLGKPFQCGGGCAPLYPGIEPSCGLSERGWRCTGLLAGPDPACREVPARHGFWCCP